MTGGTACSRSQYLVIDKGPVINYRIWGGYKMGVLFNLTKSGRVKSFCHAEGEVQNVLS